MNQVFRRPRWGLRMAQLFIALSFVLIIAAPKADAFLVGLGYRYLQLLQTTDAVHHDLYLHLEPETFTARFVDDFTVQARKNTSTVYVILGIDYEISEVTTPAGEPLAFRRHLGLGALPFIIYRIDLDKQLLHGEETTVRITYYTDPDTAEMSFPFAADDIFFTVIPMFWYPQMPTEGFFTATIHLESPSSFQFIADGKPVEGTDEKVWETVAPVSGLGVAAGNFTKFEEIMAGRQVGAWHTPYNEGRVKEVARRTAEAVQYFEELLEPLFLDRLDVVALPWGLDGSTGHYAWTLYDATMEELPLADDIMLTYMAAHEAAHKWIGFTAGLHLLNTPWISEGLTDYLALLFVEHTHGTAAMRSAIEQRHITPLSQFEGRWRALSSIDFTDEDLPIAYQKGALVFRTLHRRLGDEAFFTLVQRFIETYRHQHPTSREFVQLVQSVGGQAAAQFAANWVNGARELDYALNDVTVSQTDDEYQVAFRVVSVGQIVEPEGVEVLIQLLDGSEHFAYVSLNEHVRLSYKHPVASVVVDPNYWLPDWRRTNNVWRID